jgi:glycosyltransferase involved in cell wall biosynthesis
LESYGQAPRVLIKEAGAKLFTFRVVRIYGITGLIQGFKFFRFLRDNKVDILQSYHFSSDIWGAFWGRLARVPVIISNRRDMGFWRSFVHVLTYRLVNRSVNKVVVNASAMRDHFIKTEGLSFDKFEVIYNGVELPDPKEIPSPEEVRSQFSISKEDVVLMHVANLKPIKGHSYLLKAFKGVLAQHPHVKLFLIGEDATNGSVRLLAEELGIVEHVFFVGKHPDVKVMLPAADICLLPSLSEGMSNAILEYMAAGKPVIATNVGGNPELIDHGFNGILVEKENSQQLQDAILKLIADPRLREKMGNNGLEKVRRLFSMNAMVSNYERLYSSINLFIFLSYLNDVAFL